MKSSLRKKYITINRSVILHNKKYNNQLVPCRVQVGSRTKYAREVIINGPSKLIYTPDKPLKCGAKLYIETESDIELVDEIEYKELAKIMDKNRKLK